MRQINETQYHNNTFTTKNLNFFHTQHLIQLHNSLPLFHDPCPISNSFLAQLQLTLIINMAAISISITSFAIV